MTDVQSPTMIARSERLKSPLDISISGQLVPILDNVQYLLRCTAYVLWTWLKVFTSSALFITVSTLQDMVPMVLIIPLYKRNLTQYPFTYLFQKLESKYINHTILKNDFQRLRSWCKGEEYKEQDEEDDRVLFCKYCGKKQEIEEEDGALYCLICSAEVEEVEGEEEEEGMTIRSYVFLSAVVATGGLLACLRFYIWYTIARVCYTSLVCLYDYVW